MKTSIDYLSSVAIKNSVKPSYSCISFDGDTAIAHNENVIAWVSGMPINFDSKVMVPAHRLSQSVGAIGESFDVSLDGDQVVISGGDSSFSIPVIAGECGATIPLFDCLVEVPSPSLMCQSLSNVAFAHDANKSTTVLTGVFVTKDKVVATDGKVLAEMSGEYPDIKAIIPVSSIPYIVGCMEGNDSAKISVSGGALTVVSGDRGVRVRLIEGHYPNYGAAIPSSFEKKWSVSRKSLIKAVKNASLMASIASPAVVIDGNGDGCYVTNMITNSGTSKTLVEGGPQGKIAYNGVYLNNILSRLQSDTVEFNDGGKGRGAVIYEGSCMYLIMPVTI